MFFKRGDSSQIDLTGSVAEYLRSEGLLSKVDPWWGRKKRIRVKLLLQILNTNTICPALSVWGPEILSHPPSWPLAPRLLSLSLLLTLLQPHWPTRSHLRAFAHAVPSAWNAFPADGHMAAPPYHSTLLSSVTSPQRPSLTPAAAVNSPHGHLLSQ